MPERYFYFFNEMRKPKSKRVGIIKYRNMETALYLAMGWCGINYPNWWKSFLKKAPLPDPDPCWKVAIIGIGLISGLAGGTFFSTAIHDNQFFLGQTAVTSGLFAFAVSNIVTGIASTLN